MEKRIILLAGGTGFIGKALAKALVEQGHEVRILSRKASDYSTSIFNWDPYNAVIDKKALDNVDTIINLTGAGVADKRWTNKRKEELERSRIVPAQFLFSCMDKLPSLKQYISASGINAYDFTNYSKIYAENDDFGKDYLSQLVRKWEKAADLFDEKCVVSKIRISVVLDKNGGALQKMAKPFRFGFGAALGTGKQWMPWIHLKDLVSLFQHVLNQNLEGTFNAVSQVDTNQTISKNLATQLKKPFFLPNVPAFVLKLALGEMSSILLEGVNVSNSKIKQTGFQFQFDTIEKALEECVN